MFAVRLAGCMMSFKTDQDIFAFPPKLLFTPTLDNYAGLWDSARSAARFVNSAVVSVGSTAAGAAGRRARRLCAVAHDDRAARSRSSLLILASRMAPPIAFTIPYFLVYRHFGLLDTLTGLILIYLTFNLSLVVWLMRSFFDACPRSLEEAAWIDGASLWQGFCADRPADLRPRPRRDRHPMFPLLPGTTSSLR